MFFVQFFMCYYILYNFSALLMYILLRQLMLLIPGMKQISNKKIISELLLELLFITASSLIKYPLRATYKSHYLNYIIFLKIIFI